MIEKTNYQMLNDLGFFKPRKHGVLDVDEVIKLRKHFQINERNDIDLQNLRDYVVMFFAFFHTKHEDEDIDVLSAICGVIDDEKEKRGLEV